MFGKLGDLSNLLKSAGQIQAKMAELQQELSNRRYEKKSPEGWIQVVVDGRGTLIDLKIDSQATQDFPRLEVLIRTTIQSAISESQEAMKKDMSELTGGMNLPGMDGLLGNGG